jgi:uncharacterized protein
MNPGRVPLIVLLFTAIAVCAAQEKFSPQAQRRSGSARSVASKVGHEHFTNAIRLIQARLYEDAMRELRLAILANDQRSIYYHMLGDCLEHLRRYDEAVSAFHQALLLNPADRTAWRAQNRCTEASRSSDNKPDPLSPTLTLKTKAAAEDRWLGYTNSELADVSFSIESAKKKAFDKPYRKAIELMSGNRFAEASEWFTQAVQVDPDSFEANFWRGVNFVRMRKFSEAVPNFEKASALRPGDAQVQGQLFATYLAAQEFRKVAQTFPVVTSILGGVLTFAYLVGLAVLLPFSLRVRAPVFPGLRFSVSWLALFYEGQIAFLLLLALLPWFTGSANIFAGLVIAGLPVIVIAATGFVRQPWGEPFRWPWRFGGWKSLCISLLLLFALWLTNAALSSVYAQLTHKPVPLQNTIPLMVQALRTNPVISWLSIPLIIPIVEEILFRGLFYGALQKRWGVKAAIIGSALVFALVHLQLVGFFYLFCFGLILGWARCRSGSLGLPIALHCLNNALLMLALTFTPPV